MECGSCPRSLASFGTLYGFAKAVGGDTRPSPYGAVFADGFNDDEELEDRRGVTRSMAPDAD
jgi:hypothetical protein